jgi:hypothetical protein
MGRFDNDPPCKLEKVSVPGWEEFGEVEIRQVNGIAGQSLIDLAKTAARAGEDALQGKDIDYHAKVLNICATIGGETPPMEWLTKVPFGTLKHLVGIAMNLNSLSSDAGEKLEKN